MCFLRFLAWTPRCHLKPLPQDFSPARSCARASTRMRPLQQQELSTLSCQVQVRAKVEEMGVRRCCCLRLGSTFFKSLRSLWATISINLSFSLCQSITISIYLSICLSIYSHLAYPVLSHVMSCHVMSCHILPHLVPSDLIYLSFSFPLRMY